MQLRTWYVAAELMALGILSKRTLASFQSPPHGPHNCNRTSLATPLGLRCRLRVEMSCHLEEGVQYASSSARKADPPASWTESLARACRRSRTTSNASMTS